MGYTSHTISMLEMVIKQHKPQNVLDLGSQQLYNQPKLPAPYASEWYLPQGIKYTCIDLNGENGALVCDLSEPTANIEGPNSFNWDMVVDAGTSEHIGKNGKFSWEAIYNCWHTKFKAVKIGGVIYSENPAEGHWPGHGFSYYTFDFYHKLHLCSGLNLLKWGHVCAMGNCETGKNVWAVQIKVSDQWPSLEIFKTLPLKQS